MKQQQLKRHRHRMALHSQCMDAGVWASDSEFRDWLKDEFGVTSRTELTDRQQTRYYRWLRAYLGLGPKPAVSPGKITNKQRAKIDNLISCLGWSNSDLTGFIERQTGAKMLLSSLSIKQASVVINGLLKINDPSNKQKV